jgi:molybdate transport system substrate-binding protein
LWTTADSPLQIKTVADLALPEVKRIAIANPDHAPYGLAAQQALQRAGVWDQVKPKLVYADNIRQTLQYAETGNVDVAIVALSLSQESKGRWVLVPEQLHDPIDQALAVIKTTRNEAAARAFASFISGPRGREILGKYGFAFP